MSIDGGARIKESNSSGSRAVNSLDKALSTEICSWVAGIAEWSTPYAAHCRAVDSDAMIA